LPPPLQVVKQNGYTLTFQLVRTKPYEVSPEPEWQDEESSLDPMRKLVELRQHTIELQLIVN